jgi:hypothetical protein
MRKSERKTKRINIATLAASLALAATAGAYPASAPAGELMFRRSYFTHAIPPELEGLYPIPESRSAYRPALAGATPGFAIRGAYRFDRMFLRSGSSTDLTVFRGDWYEINP